MTAEDIEDSDSISISIEASFAEAEQGCTTHEEIIPVINPQNFNLFAVELCSVPTGLLTCFRLLYIVFIMLTCCRAR